MQEFLLFIAVLVAYFVPSVVADARKHPQVWAIFTLNLFLGWTGIGWVFALVWSVTAIPQT